MPGANVFSQAICVLFRKRNKPVDSKFRGGYIATRENFCFWNIRDKTFDGCARRWA